MRVKVKNTIDMHTFISFVDEVKSISIDENGKYNAAFEAIALRYCIAKYLTDYKISDDISEVFLATQEKWFKDVQIKLAKTSYFSTLITSVENSRKNSLDFMCDKIIKTVDLFGDKTLTEVIDKLNSISDCLTSKETVNKVAERVATKNG